MTQEVPLEAHPLDFNPPPNVQSVRAAARHTRLLEAQEAGQDVDPDEIERYREAAYGKVDKSE
jgi:hypothetical protein